jgi:hypothetical protein
MSGVEEVALLAALAEGAGAAGTAATAAGTAASAGGALAGAGSVLTPAMLGVEAGVAGTGLLGAGVTSGVGAGATLSAEELAMIQAMDAGGTAVAQGTGQGLAYGAGDTVTNSLLGSEFSSLPYGAGDTVTSSMTSNMLGDLGGGNLGNMSMLSDPSSVLASDATGNQFVTQGDKYWNMAQQGLRTLGKGVNKLGTAGTVKSLLDPPKPAAPAPMPARPSGGGQPPAQAQYAQQQPTQVQPYAPIFGGAGPDEAEMRRRKMLLMQQRGY